MSDIRHLQVLSGSRKSQADITDELCEKIKELVFSYSGQMSVATAIGTLVIATKEILDAQDE